MMPESQADAATVAELEALMREFPDWKEKFPDVYTDVNPPRYTKINRKGRQDPTEKKFKQRATSVPVTDYQGTYKATYQRPRSTKRPPPSPRDLNPPPMTFETNQRHDFIPKDVRVRPDPIKMEETYEAPSGPLESLTNYKKDYPGHYELPKVKTVQVDPTQGLIKRSTAKFSNQTTTREHFRKWAPDHTLTFGELPSFTDSILYPGQNRHMETTTGTTFKGKHIERPDLIPHGGGNIKIEGSHDMTTTHDRTYKPYASARPAEKVRPREEKIVQNRVKFDAKTQSQKDFPYHQGHQPPRSVDPAPTTIQLQYDYNRSFETEQKGQYPGIDVKTHPMLKSCKKDDESYRRPDVKFHTDTNQKLDYKPIDVTKVYKPPTKQPVETRKDQSGKFDGRTMNDTFFKRWEISPRPRFGDFHEGHNYIPPMDKFQGSSTTKSTFVPKRAEIQPNYKPENKVVEAEGDHDFNTMYNSTFVKPNMMKNLSKSQATDMLKELRKMKAGGKNYGKPSRHVIAV